MLHNTHSTITTTEQNMPHMSERAELNDVIARTREGIAERLVELGVKPGAAVRAVAKQVKFGRAPNGTILMKRGAWVAATPYKNDCAAHILPSIPPEQRKDFSSGDAEEEMWAVAERRLYDSHPVLSREQLLEREREAVIAKARGELGDQDSETLSIAELAERKRTGTSVY